VGKKPSLRQRLRAFFVRILSGSANRSDEFTAAARPNESTPVTRPDESTPAPTTQLSPLARYLYDKAHFSAENKRVKERAFLPPPNLRLSVFVVDALEHQEIVDLGQTVTQRELRAYATLEDSITKAQGLRVERDDTPFRHAEIAGWPAEKEHQKEIAQELASAATLHPL
jgi:hypothetical protein